MASAPGRSPPLAASASQPGLGCIAGKHDRPQGSPSGWDARVYNLWTTLDFATNGLSGVSTYERGSFPVISQRANDSYYRYLQADCREVSSTHQMACFVAHDACSIGFGGKDGIDAFGVRGLQLLGNDGLPADPTQADAQLYPLATDLRFCQLQEFRAGDLSLQSEPFLAAQQLLWDDVLAGDPNGVLAAATTHDGHHLSLPAPVKTCCQGTYNPVNNRCQ